MTIKNEKRHGGNCAVSEEHRNLEAISPSYNDADRERVA